MNQGGDTPANDDRDLASSTVQALIDAAIQAKGRAYCPYSGYQVGAALLTDTGIFSGANVENASYPAGICAERTAGAKAVSEGASSFRALAVAVGGGFAYPCGVCRQFLSEFIDPDAPVFLVNGANEVSRDTFARIFPAAFSKEDML